MIPKFNAASHIPLMSDRMSLDWEKVAREVTWLEDSGVESIVISVPAGTPYLTNDTVVEYVEAASEVEAISRNHMRRRSATHGGRDGAFFRG